MCTVSSPTDFKWDKSVHKGKHVGLFLEEQGLRDLPKVTQEVWERKPGVKSWFH